MSESLAPAPTPADRPAPRGLVGRIAAAWSGRHREVIRADLAAGVTEARLLAYVMGVGLLSLLTTLPAKLAERAQLAAAPGGGEALSVGEVVTMHVVADLFFLPLFLYGVAALIRIVLRLFGGEGGWQATRLAVFWAPIAAAPAALVAAAATSLLTVAGAAPMLTDAPGALAGLIGLWFWCAGLAEAHGFRRAWPAFAAIVLIWIAGVLVYTYGSGAAA
ncbi:YIP1 family protein [Albimonas sp. CAU 1670]|uniref:YIP1 family protein n=1 Tax=Albimonas sp. CAU 1670 TaxID=3032599 RepID=UPI0023DBD9AB|nr:YIP1 family protein [Albimonas sp. CAU 1670]MDF2232555.1 YIP1 family protein [Albimonas sp. CAU 1670]